MYDVTGFLLEHPGGDDIVIDSSGRDATREFEDVGHSGEARSQLEDLYIGELREPTEEELRVAEEEAKIKGEAAKKSGASSWLKTVGRWALPVGLIVIAYVIRNYVK